MASMTATVPITAAQAHSDTDMEDSFDRPSRWLGPERSTVFPDHPQWEWPRLRARMAGPY
ncbi:hypothetical protein CS0771_53570 [Catellatospora sp. IY07-71]|nr:hypothetical protein CS0771_53570 [Catellatospora sp. IY07-71]